MQDGFSEPRRSVSREGKPAACTGPCSDLPPHWNACFRFHYKSQPLQKRNQVNDTFVNFQWPLATSSHPKVSSSRKAFRALGSLMGLLAQLHTGRTAGLLMLPTPGCWFLEEADPSLSPACFHTATHFSYTLALARSSPQHIPVYCPEAHHAHCCPSL